MRYWAGELVADRGVVKPLAVRGEGVLPSLATGLAVAVTKPKTAADRGIHTERSSYEK